MTRPASPPSSPRFEIIDERHIERHMRKRRSRRTGPGTIATLFGAVRAVIEDGYVSLAKGAMSRAERIEDTRASRAYAKRVREAERQRRRQTRTNDTAPPKAPTRSVPAS